MKKGIKRVLSFTVALVLVISLLPASLLVADAAGSLTVTDAKIGLSWTDASSNKGSASWSASGNTVTGTATGYTQYVISRKSVTTTLTITNGYSEERTLEFTYSLSGGGSVSGLISSTSGTYSGALAGGASVTITLTSPTGSGNTNTLTLSGIQLLGNEAVSSTFKAPVNGSYTVDGAAITADTVLEKVATESYALVATPASGYKFYGWWSNTSSSYISKEASASLNFAVDPQLEPKFLPADQALFSVGGVTFPTLTEAGAYAATVSTKTIVPVSDGVVYGAQTIPSGVTLLIPFDSGNTLYTTSPSCTSSFLNNVAWVQPTAYRTLTLDSTASITVNGAISVSAKHAAANGGKDFCGAPTGPCGFMNLEEGSSITLNSGAKLYAWGFITGSGTINALSGASVYENFQFTDFRGGTVTTDLAEAKIAFPMSQFYVQNIEAPITFHQGSQEILTTSVFMSQMCLNGDMTFIGTGGLFVPGTGGYVTKTYDGSRDRLRFDVYENASINSISLTLSGITVDSADFVLPINNNIDIHVHSGVGNVSQSLALLPGTSITVDEGATINLNYTSTATNSYSIGHNVILYDADQWSGGENMDTGAAVSGYYVFYNNANTQFAPIKYAPGKAYTRTVADLVDAVADINGTVNANGFLYTTQGGANVISSKGTGRINLISGAGAEPYSYQHIQNVATVRIPIVSALLKNADGSFTETADAAAGDAYIYDTELGKWVKAGPFTITWKDEQGNVLKTEEVARGTVPSYGTAPTKASDAANHYTFSSWTPAVVAATDHTTYTAVFTTEAHILTTTTVDATCTANGSTISTCSVCGYTTSETLAATGHANTETVTVPATCTAAGSVTVTCKDCGEVLSSEVLAALGHSYTSEVTTAPTCTEDGVESFTCTVCGDTYTETLAATGHVDTETVTVPATCTEAGSVTVTCACGEVVSTEVLNALGHSYEAVVTSATCETAGYTTYTCTVCGDTYTADETAALGHSYETVVTPATCETAGYTTYTCTVCGDTYTADETAALGHSYETVVTPATCETAGYTTYTCTVCGNTYTADEIAATGHINTETVTVNASCTEDGSVTVTCKDCGEVVSTEVLEATGHSYESVVTAPTCTAGGYTTYTCSVCGDTYTADDTQATGHINTETVTLDATCTENGSVTVICKDCGQTLSSETVDALGHSYETVVTAPTCETIGYTTYTCSVCGDTYIADETAATGHSYSYVNNGNDHTVTCSNCDYNLTEAHNYVDGTCICGADEAVASVTDGEGNVTKYASLIDAIAAAATGDTVTLLADVTMEERIIIDAEDDIILDLGGKTLTTCGTPDNYDIVIKGDLTILDSSEAQTGTLVATGIYGIGVSTTAGSGLTIESGNFTQVGDYYLIGSWGTVTINGGSFYAPYCTVNAFDGTASITGGSFSSDASDSVLIAGNVVLTGGTYDRDVKEYCAEEYIAEAGESETYTVIPCEHSNTTTETVPATCVDAGSATTTCSDCGKLLSTEAIAATGHLNTETVTVDATCTTEGSVTVICQDCGETLSTETVEALGHNYETVVTAPTCEAGGFTTYTCSVCGDTYTADETAATGHSHSYTNNGDDHTVTCANCDYNVTEAHNYVDGTCICGAVEVVEPEEPTELDIKISHSVSFDSDLKMNYRIKLENIAAAISNYVTDGAYLVVEKDRYPVSGGLLVETVTLYPDLTTDATRMLFNLGGIQSVEMGSELRAVLHIFDAEGKEYVTPVDVYSVLAYAQLCYDSYSYAAQPQLYTMLIDALNYGAAAQTYFGRRADELVNAGMDAYQQYATTALSEELTDVRIYEENDREITAVTKMGFSVTFDDKTEMNAKLTVADGYTTDDITCVKVLNEAGEVVDTLTELTLLDDGRLQVTYYGVKSIQMREMFYFVAYVGDQAASQNVGYSVEAFAKSSVAGTNANLADMALKCMYYGDAAYAYFNR